MSFIFDLPGLLRVVSRTASLLAREQRVETLLATAGRCRALDLRCAQVGLTETSSMRHFRFAKSWSSLFS
jgi:hypothetical protein